MIAERIFHWADQTPDKTAVVHNGRPWSYRAFARLIALSRGNLVKQGVEGPGAAVVVTANLMEFWIMSFALRSLGLYTINVPQAKEIASLGLPEIRVVAASALDKDADLPEICAARRWRLVRVSLDGQSPLDLGRGPVRWGGHVLLTSGTTGFHKKVLMDSGFEDALLRFRRELQGITQESVVDAFHFPAWTGLGYKTSASTWDAGGTIVIHQAPDPRLSLFPPDPHRSLCYPGLTHASMVPPLLDRILAAPAGAFPRNESLRIQIGGGTVGQEKIDQAKARIGPIVYNGVSSTETSIFALTLLETPEDRRWHRPVPGRSLEIVDELGQPTPMDEVGRVRVSTANGPTGYLHDEKATKAFFKDGFFYPGDLAVMRADGRIALQGRVTDTINLKGAKIAPAPIEEALAQDFKVAGVCVFSMQNEDGEEELHVIIERRVALPVERVVRVLSSRLAGFPRANVHYLPALPRDAMGKLQRELAKKEALSYVKRQARNVG